MAGLNVEYGKISNKVYIHLMWNELKYTAFSKKSQHTGNSYFTKFDFRIFISESASF